MFKIFVDGEAGTTGLQIYERLAKRQDVEILRIQPELRKDPAERARLINSSDVTFLCLPDAAAVESAALCTNPKTKIIDASTAHRTNPDWAYGLPELSSDFRKQIESGTRIANPGCHATGFIFGVYPLIAAGLLQKRADLATYSLTGYSGGGKKMIASYEADGAQQSHPGESPRLFAPRPYALGHHHKHLPEMQKICGLENAPLFNPIVGPFYKGMAVSTAIFPSSLTKSATASDIQSILAEHYDGSRFVKVLPYEEEPVLDAGSLDPTECNGTNEAHIYVFGKGNSLQVTTIIDNLGKGASGAAIQNMNIALGIDESSGLV
ncbi:N-acetyl-gamma-glutamyl-phosphate reductase [Fibrobacter intestinalis]|uniref:N-acetyl-gamma-glutamyl-phosphate reductase n=1 Tax=Fibrobacter intestinalis TaxID=28122 RepID=A0A1T4M8A9_9BACT|nr:MULTISPECIES: N-acetyl-gamma-glutamyl-phosphate reductase [Fibrobacter]PBC73581.1 N-acetyl-gamma-glutamyl-phosphate reductase [Fibrobacter sp. NR9]SJZ63253.1 N-acetyl-gamma-glutamyl-phosphate reductase [Fibrobacter intestinalis]